MVDQSNLSMFHLSPVVNIRLAVATCRFVICEINRAAITSNDGIHRLARYTRAYIIHSLFRWCRWIYILWRNFYCRAGNSRAQNNSRIRTRIVKSRVAGYSEGSWALLRSLKRSRVISVSRTTFGVITRRTTIQRSTRVRREYALFSSPFYINVLFITLA